MPEATLNASAYHFVQLHELPALRERLFDSASARGLKGTVLLAEEGINLVLAGPAAALRDWLAALRADPRFAPIEPQFSHSAAPPLRHLRVKIKREIIRMNEPTVRPVAGRAASVAPRTLARWLDQGRCDAGRPLALLDTRNAFEVDAGAFDGALDWRLARFSDFPAALRRGRSQLAGRTVVSYCTGGIRCEKAALLMQAEGIEHALQLEGGILRYFAQTQGAPHWRGSCFVFDERIVLDTSLAPAAR